jgi:hypothetical protein
MFARTANSSGVIHIRVYISCLILRLANFFLNHCKTSKIGVYSSKCVWCVHVDSRVQIVMFRQCTV